MLYHFKRDENGRLTSEQTIFGRLIVLVLAKHCGNDKKWLPSMWADSESGETVWVGHKIIRTGKIRILRIIFMSFMIYIDLF